MGEHPHGFKPLPKLLSSLDVLAGEERDVWEAQVLVAGEDPTRKQVRLAHVVDEAADVPIEVGIDAVNVLWLRARKRERYQDRRQERDRESQREKDSSD